MLLGHPRHLPPTRPARFHVVGMTSSSLPWPAPAHRVDPTACRAGVLAKSMVAEIRSGRQRRAELTEPFLLSSWVDRQDGQPADHSEYARMSPPTPTAKHRFILGQVSESS